MKFLLNTMICTLLCSMFVLGTVAVYMAISYGVYVHNFKQPNPPAKAACCDPCECCPCCACK